MSFDTPNGTRGARQPGGSAIYRWMQSWMVNRVRRKGGKVRGQQVLVLTTVGRKSGEERSNPVMWFPDDEGSRLIVASAAGAARHPAWYYNLAAHPDRIHVEMAGQKEAVTAEELHGDEREQAWKQITATAPNFAKYEQKTDRQLPVIRLRSTP